MKPLTWQEIKILLVICSVAVCGMLGVDLHLASLPSIMQFMHTDKAHMQQSISIFLLGMGSSLLVYGPLSDKYGRKPLMIFGLLLASASAFFCVFTQDIQSFLLSRLLQGIGAGVCMGLGRTILVDMLAGERVATIGSYFSMFLSLSPLLAPALGGYVQHWFGWQANFVLWGTLLAASCALFACLCPESNQHKNPKAASPKILYENYKFLLLHPVFVGATLLTGISAAGFMVYATVSPFMLQGEFHITPIVYGWITAIATSANLLGKTISPTCIRRQGSARTLWIGLLLLCLAGVVLLAAALLHLLSLPVIILAVFLSILSQGFVMPIVAMYALSPFHDKRGTAGALYGAFQMLTAFVVSAITGLAQNGGVMVLTVAFCALGLAALAVYYGILQRSKISELLNVK